MVNGICGKEKRWRVTFALLSKKCTVTWNWGCVKLLNQQPLHSHNCTAKKPKQTSATRGTTSQTSDTAIPMRRRRSSHFGWLLLFAKRQHRRMSQGKQRTWDTLHRSYGKYLASGVPIFRDWIASKFNKRKTWVGFTKKLFQNSRRMPVLAQFSLPI